MPKYSKKQQKKPSQSSQPSTSSTAVTSTTIPQNSPVWQTIVQGAQKAMLTGGPVAALPYFQALQQTPQAQQSPANSLFSLPSGYAFKSGYSFKDYTLDPYALQWNQQQAIPAYQKWSQLMDEAINVWQRKAGDVDAANRAKLGEIGYAKGLMGHYNQQGVGSDFYGLPIATAPIPEPPQFHSPPDLYKMPWLPISESQTTSQSHAGTGPGSKSKTSLSLYAANQTNTIKVDPTHPITSVFNSEFSNIGTSTDVQSQAVTLFDNNMQLLGVPRLYVAPGPSSEQDKREMNEKALTQLFPSIYKNGTITFSYKDNKGQQKQTVYQVDPTRQPIENVGMAFFKLMFESESAKTDLMQRLGSYGKFIKNANSPNEMVNGLNQALKQMVIDANQNPDMVTRNPAYTGLNEFIRSRLGYYISKKNNPFIHGMWKTLQGTDNTVYIGEKKEEMVRNDFINYLTAGILMYTYQAPGYLKQ